MRLWKQVFTRLFFEVIEPELKARPNGYTPEDVELIAEVFRAGWTGGIEAVTILNDTNKSNREKELEKVLTEILSKFPANDIIGAIIPDKGLGYRLTPMYKSPTDKDILGWRKVLNND